MRYLISTSAFITFEVEASSEGEALALSRQWNTEHPTLSIEGYPELTVLLGESEVLQVLNVAEDPPILSLVKGGKPS